MNTLELWSNYFEQQELDSWLRKIYLKYIDSLLQNNVPIIFETNHLSLIMGVERSELAKFANSSNNFYRTFTIPKRKGGARLITAPYPLLAYCQNWIYVNILKSLKLHECCFGFVEGKSVLDNANIHVGAKSLLTIDISDFFGSISISRVTKVFMNFGYSNRLSFFLASLCCYEKALPQGACTSPILSNIIAKRLDRRLFGLAQKLNLKYSRYADDITFSGDMVPRNLLGILTKIINDEGFDLNSTKTRFKSGNSKKIVTGLSVGGNEVRIIKKYKREFRKDFYFFVKNGLEEFNTISSGYDPLYLDRLIGKANYILHVEPDNNYVNNALKYMVKFKIENL